jgi:hypothetical protein
MRTWRATVGLRRGAALLAWLMLALPTAWLSHRLVGAVGLILLIVRRRTAAVI